MYHLALRRPAAALPVSTQSQSAVWRADPQASCDVSCTLPHVGSSHAVVLFPVAVCADRSGPRRPSRAVSARCNFIITFIMTADICCPSCLSRALFTPAHTIHNRNRRHTGHLRPFPEHISFHPRAPTTRQVHTQHTGSRRGYGAAKWPSELESSSALQVYALLIRVVSAHGTLSQVRGTDPA